MFYFRVLSYFQAISLSSFCVTTWKQHVVYLCEYVQVQPWALQPGLCVPINCWVVGRESTVGFINSEFHPFTFSLRTDPWWGENDGFLTLATIFCDAAFGLIVLFMIILVRYILCGLPFLFPEDVGPGVCHEMGKLVTTIRSSWAQAVVRFRHSDLQVGSLLVIRGWFTPN